MADEPLLQARGLTVEYGEGARSFRAVVDVDLSVGAGEFLAIVGESGCGKSTLCNAIAQLLPTAARVTQGDVLFRGVDLVTLSERALRELRWRDYAVVMQSAMNALNPVLTVGEQFRDALAAHEPTSRRDARARASDALELVGVAGVHVDSYPHQLSGGMRQRAMIAMALAFTPDLLIMDEPTSALDVVAQRALMKEIKRLQGQLGFAVIFVTHDISLVSRFSDRVAVMYAGQLAELNDTSRLFSALHPYTVALLESYPSISNPKVKLQGIPGNPPDLRSPAQGCRFSPRCRVVMAQCHEVEPALTPIGSALVRCLRYEEDEANGR